MYKEDIINHLKKRVEEEKEDVLIYKMLAEECDKNGYQDYARILYDIAHDESSHTLYISKIIDEYTKRS